MKPANASAMRSTSDQVSVHRHIRSPDELTLSLRPSQFRMSCSPIASTCDSHVKQRCRAVPTASSLPVAVPHAVAATASVKFGWEHSCQGDFVKLSTGHKVSFTKEAVKHVPRRMYGHRESSRVLQRLDNAPARVHEAHDTCLTAFLVISPKKSNTYFTTIPPLPWRVAC